MAASEATASRPEKKLHRRVKCSATHSDSDEFHFPPRAVHQHPKTCLVNSNLRNSSFRCCGSINLSSADFEWSSDFGLSWRENVLRRTFDVVGTMKNLVSLHSLDTLTLSPLALVHTLESCIERASESARRPKNHRDSGGGLFVAHVIYSGEEFPARFLPVTDTMQSPPSLSAKVEFFLVLYVQGDSGGQVPWLG